MATIPRRRMRLNNRKLAAFRKEQIYEAMFADLVLMGALDKALVEDYFNLTIPSELVPPFIGTPSEENDSTEE